MIKQQVVRTDFNSENAEIIDALALERYMSKEDILASYLNVAPFRRNNKGQKLAGVEEAAQRNFGCLLASYLTVHSAALLLELPQESDCLFSLHG